MIQNRIKSCLHIQFDAVIPSVEQQRISNPTLSNKELYGIPAPNDLILEQMVQNIHTMFVDELVPIQHDELQSRGIPKQLIEPIDDFAA